MIDLPSSSRRKRSPWMGLLAAGLGTCVLPLDAAMAAFSPEGMPPAPAGVGETVPHSSLRQCDEAERLSRCGCPSCATSRQFASRSRMQSESQQPRTFNPEEVKRP